MSTLFYYYEVKEILMLVFSWDLAWAFKMAINRENVLIIAFTSCPVFAQPGRCWQYFENKPFLLIHIRKLKSDVSLLIFAPSNTFSHQFMCILYLVHVDPFNITEMSVHTPELWQSINKTHFTGCICRMSHTLS